MKPARIALLLVAAALLLAGCRARFPTGKFAAPEPRDTRFLIFYPDGRWEGYQGGNLLTYGQYAADGAKITFETDFQCQDAGLPEQVTYAWSYTSKVLTFQPSIADPCASRAALLAGEFRPSQ